MPPQGDWPESRERVNLDLKRNAEDIGGVRKALTDYQLQNQKDLSNQTTELKDTINGNHLDTTSKIAELSEEIKIDVNTLKTKFAMWFVIASFFGTIAATVLAAIIVKSLNK